MHGGSLTTIGPARVRTHADERWYLARRAGLPAPLARRRRREHEAGDLSDEDHDVLVARDSARLAEVEAELCRAGARTDASEPAGGLRQPQAESPKPTAHPAPCGDVRSASSRACLLIGLAS